MSKNWNDITIALSGIFQAATLVDQLAKTGYVTSSAQETSIKSILATNPDDTLSVYGGDVSNLEMGLKSLISCLNHQPEKNAKDKSSADILRYILGLQHLQKKLLGRKDMMDTIGSRINKASHQVDHFSVDHENVLANLAGIYTDTISTFKFRIQVTGDYNYLQQRRIANQVRALLFAGIRSTMLWQQAGGTRFQMLWQRKRILDCARSLLNGLANA